MNKKILVFIMSLAILGGITFLAVSAPDNSANKGTAKSDAQSSSQATTNNQAAVNQESGKYIDYSQTAIADNSGTKLLFFYAPWCPQCRAIEEDINTLGAPSGVTIIKVDYDSNQKLRQKYGVTIQTTFVKVDDSGELISKFVAYDEPTLDSVIKNIL